HRRGSLCRLHLAAGGAAPRWARLDRKPGVRRVQRAAGDRSARRYQKRADGRLCLLRGAREGQPSRIAAGAEAAAPPILPGRVPGLAEKPSREGGCAMYHKSDSFGELEELLL